MPKFEVGLTRTSDRRYVLEVDAADEAEARRKALNQAGDLNFFDGTESYPEYGIEGVKEVVDGECEGCDGSGIRPWTGRRPSERGNAGKPPKGFVIVEKCDTCDKFKSDLDAAKAWGTHARWQSRLRTSQAIAKPKKERKP